MKRLISLLIALSMLAASILAIALYPAADEAESGEPTAPNYHLTAAGLYDDKLVAYYNFLGETLEEQMADKAPAGESDDNLTSTANVTVQDGYAYIPSTSGEYIGVFAEDGDTNDLANKTLFIAYTASGNAVQYATDLISANKVFRYWLAKGSVDTLYKMGGGVGSAPTQAGKFQNLGTAPTNPTGAWYYTAITINMTEDELVVTIYNSADGVNYVAGTTVFADANKPADLLRNEIPLLIGKNSPTIGDRGLSFKVSEFRIYNEVLSAAEVKNLSFITPGQTTGDLPTPDATTEGTTTKPTEPQPPVELPERLPVAALYDENLVAYYDFEGDNDAVRAHDKAPSGSTVDTLTFANIIANNGIAYISSAAGSYISIDTKEGDTADLANKTLYLVFTATGSASPTNDLIASTRTFRYWMLGGSGDDNFAFGGGIGASPTTTGYKLSTNKEAPTRPSGDWYYVAITLDMQETSLVITAYNSANGKEYSAITDVFSNEFKPENLLRTASLLIGKAGTTTADRGISYYIDEFRIYDRVLEADEIANLVYTVPGTKTVIPEEPVVTTPEVTDAPSTPTTEAPTQTDAPVVTTAKPAVTTKAPTAASTTEAAPGTTEATTTGSSQAATGGCKGALIAPFAVIAIASAAAMMIVRKKD